MVFFNILFLLIRIIEILILIRVLLSWIPFQNEFTSLVYTITEPLLKPFRVFIPLGTARLDISPFLLYLILRIVKVLLIKVFM